MILEEYDLAKLMAWARDQAPLKRLSTPEYPPGSYRRRVRLELALGPEVYNLGMASDCVIASVFLAEPRCLQLTNDPARTAVHANCECGPLAERRLI